MGRALVTALRRVDGDLCEPEVRALIERECSLVAAAAMEKEDVLRKNVALFQDKFQTLEVRAKELEPIFEGRDPAVHGLAGLQDKVPFGRSPPDGKRGDRKGGDKGRRVQNRAGNAAKHKEPGWSGRKDTAREALSQGARRNGRREGAGEALGSVRGHEAWQFPRRTSEWEAASSGDQGGKARRKNAQRRRRF
eukprot:CAMPEP_0117593816 /NCGR_PEP_ID=MMETSP0784-20121206/72847_1 /TAXON_ID=39447 /ORGANISM="" /LENGTH=192 /DNA_ID=CAMNT_0005395789 /DNA_START=12 /DNA_END=590 /DNA_ORIENTATION=+